MERIKVPKLKKWFEENRKDLPKTFKLMEGSLIVDIDKFIESHFSFLESSKAKGNKAYLPYYDRLFQVYKKNV